MPNHPIIPGHFRANTIFRALFLIAFGCYATGNWAISIIGAIVLVVGSFASDQATHLQQPAHSELAETPAEQMLQRLPWLWRPVGWVVEGIGLLILLSAVP